MVDVRRLKMLQMVQLFKCEEDASQVSEFFKSMAVFQCRSASQYHFQIDFK